MNKVIAGDYKGQGVLCPLWSKPRITLPFFKIAIIDKTNVDSYEVVDRDGSTKRGVHRVAIQFKDGKRSLLEVDDRIFKAITVELF